MYELTVSQIMATPKAAVAKAIGEEVVEVAVVDEGKVVVVGTELHTFRNTRHDQPSQ